MLDTYRDLIDDLLGTPTLLREIVPVRGDGTVAPDTAALVSEFRERDGAVLLRVQTMTREQNPHLRMVPPWSGAVVEAAPVLLDGFENARGDLVSLLMNLTLKDWERTATHEIDGEITVSEEVERHVEWDEQQRQRIQAAVTGQRR